jgi:2-polyprenyl-3-methyl-5-hydroxy-6-metoxy-1,4-benzoquinol methylase
MSSTAVDETTDCPYCQTISYVGFPFSSRIYYRCPSCDLIFAKYQSETKTIDYYQTRYFDEYSGDQMSGQRTNIYRHILDVLEDYKDPGSLLDVGCGCGFFLEEASKRGWHIFGVDPSLKSIDYARSIVGNTVVCGTLDDVPTDRRYDAIVLINVLDHMVDAWQQLKKTQDRLAPAGILYLRFPNGLFHSFVLRFCRMLSAERFVKPFLIFHEYAFTPKAIKRFLIDMGFTEISVLNAKLTGGNMFTSGVSSAQIAHHISGMTWGFFKAIEKLSGGKWLWGPSLQVVAMKRDERKIL